MLSLYKFQELYLTNFVKCDMISLISSAKMEKEYES